MALPELIEIVPPKASSPVSITVPGSKSITNRALVLAALADGKVKLHGALWSEDTEIMVEALSTLGFDVDITQDPNEEANRTITVQGLGGLVRNAGTVAAPLEIFVGNAGTVTRFLMPLLCLGDGVYRMSGVTRMHQRPQAALIDSLGQLGFRIDHEGGHLPVTIHGDGQDAVRGATCDVSIEESSQFASALLLSSEAGGWSVHVTGEDAEESAFVSMTNQLVEIFPHEGGEFQIEPDCSSASYFLAAGALLPDTKLSIAAWPESDWQIDARFVEFLQRFRDTSGADWPPVSRTHDLGDAIMTAIAIAPLLPKPSRFTDLGRLRVQESERVLALRTELEKCGARVEEKGDVLDVYPSSLHAADIDTYDDHRIAMAFSTLALRVPGMRIRNPGCVRKTFPNFYARLAAASPDGLGATILDAATGRPLTGADLLAD